MEALKAVVDFILHIDDHLALMIQQYGGLTYGILFLIVFVETGLVIMPFLPGDSLLFAAGAFAKRGDLNVWLLFGLLSAAAIVGDTVNYWIGHFIGPKVFKWKKSRWFNPEHLKRAHAFYEKYGPKTIILARFVPIVRTFAPFVAGVGAMTYPTFILYNVVGGLAWVAICLFGGYGLGNLPFFQKHFELVILVIIFLSVLPMVYEFWKHKLAKPARRRARS